MTYPELISMAKQGDVNAMCQLADFIIASKDDSANMYEAFDEALPYYTTAAQKGSTYAAYKSVLAHVAYSVRARASRDMDALAQHAQSVLDYALMAIANDAFFHSSEGNQTMEYSYIAEYNLALSAYMQNNYALAFSLVTNDDNNPIGLFHILGGLCLYLIKDMQNAYKQLQSLETDSTNIFPENPDIYDHLIAASGFSALAAIYKSQGNINKAHSVLTRGINTVNPAVNGPLVEELSHYKEKLFGGYQYIE